MKKLLVYLAMLTFLFVAGDSLFARGMAKGGPAGGPGFGMMQCLNLTEDQELKIHNINKQFADKFFAARKDEAALAKVREEHRKEIEKVLTKEQVDRLNNCMGPRGNMMGKPDHKGHGQKGDVRPMGPMMMDKYLNITDEQAEKIHKINMDFHDKMFKNRKNPTEIEKLRENHRKEIEKVLTEEQLKKLNEFRDHHPRHGDGGFGPNHEWMW
ncbi:MAG TPA: hypothetical protein PKX79_10305 [Spirochaetota bacterium]|nr:hypothetical protein [Spirochaetota bacterium]HOK93066.1 hypothetical protein [Spirochaetota bacterium]HPP95761.1 hypothetical protein [Spirochaetota bacterium]